VPAAWGMRLPTLAQIVLAWTVATGDGAAVEARRYNTSGQPIPFGGPVLLVPPTEGVEQKQPLLAVLDAGKIAQIGSPRELYEYPSNRFVAGFIGKMNFFPGELTAEAVALPLHGLLAGRLPEGLATGGAAVAAVRPERMTLSEKRPESGRNALAAEIVDVAYHGQDLNLHLAIEGLAERSLVRLPAAAAEEGTWRRGAKVWCAWDPAHTRILAA